MKWDAQLYDNNHNFVSEYGKGLLEYIPEDPKQAILDLGCGTGTLTAQLLQIAGKVVGVDASADMISKAKMQYSNMDFHVCDALTLPFDAEFDIVFSNAVFHWISDHDLLLKNIRRALKLQGMLVCEFGATGNCGVIEQAFGKVCLEYDCEIAARFNFESEESFGKMLADNGFKVQHIYEFDRPTPLVGGEAGLTNWMRQFYASYLAFFTREQQEEILKKTGEIVREKLWDGSKWIADYRRLRVIAKKS